MKRAKKIFIWTFLAAVVVLACFYFWFLTGDLTEAKTKLLARLPYPIASVGNKRILSNDYFLRVAAARKLPSSQNLSDQRLNKDVLDRLVEEKKTEIVSEKYGIIVRDQEIEREFDLMKSQNGFSDGLRSYGISEKDFKTNLLKPLALKANLTKWFYSKEEYNKKAYQTAKVLLDRLNNGAEFEQLVKLYTKDPAGAVTGGDSGFIPVSELLPEVAAEAASMKIDQTKLISSRYGLHVVKLIATDTQGQNGENRLYLKQIFLFGSDFDQWLKEETESIPLKLRVKI